MARIYMGVRGDLLWACEGTASGRFGQPVGHGVGGGLGPGRAAQLAQDAADVQLGRPFGDEERLCNLAVSMAPRLRLRGDPMRRRRCSSTP